MSFIQARERAGGEKMIKSLHLEHRHFRRSLEYFGRVASSMKGSSDSHPRDLDTEFEPEIFPSHGIYRY